MKIHRCNQGGFTSLEIILIIAVIGLIGYVSISIYSEKAEEQKITQYNESADKHNNRDLSIPPDIFDVKVGETGSHYGSQITVTSTSIKNTESFGLSDTEAIQVSGPNGSNIEANSKFLIVKYTITNRSTATNTYEHDYFSLETPSKEIVRSILLKGGEEYRSQRTIAPGGSFSGKIAFPIDENEEVGSTIIWQGPYWVTASEDIRIRL